ncbi:Hypothetical protein SMAX5B_003137 [Scophthalmus maximus]|uniref:Uncharacterized protein n=1 Tax=Scophthalmus maximus TaxID=52904 RepID=A0A2U9CZN1_SCOMX|nr:Hypothetical protein SMAX5B_003137 [Scophthalmus maximus]
MVLKATGVKAAHDSVLHLQVSPPARGDASTTGHSTSTLHQIIHTSTCSSTCSSIHLTDRRSGVLSPVYSAVMSPPPGFSGGGSGWLSSPTALILRSSPVVRPAALAVSRCSSAGLHVDNGRSGGGDEEEQINKSSIGGGGGELNIDLQPKIETDR